MLLIVSIHCAAVLLKYSRENRKYLICFECKKVVPTQTICIITFLSTCGSVRKYLQAGIRHCSPLIVKRKPSLPSDNENRQMQNVFFVKMVDVLYCRMPVLVASCCMTLKYRHCHLVYTFKLKLSLTFKIVEINWLQILQRCL